MNKKFLFFIFAIFLIVVASAVSVFGIPLAMHADNGSVSCTPQDSVTANTQQGTIDLPLDSFPSATGSQGDPASSSWAKAWGVSSSGNFGWNNLSQVCDTTTAVAVPALKVHYPAHSSSPSCGCASGGAQFYAFFKDSSAMSGLSTSAPLYLRYDVRFPTGFDFGRGGKLPGLFGGSNSGISGGNHSSEAWSTRLMWRTKGTSSEGQGEIYAYYPGMANDYGADLGLGKWTFQGDDQWHPVEQEVALSGNNATATMWYDGQKVFSTQVQTGSIPVVGIFFSTFFGGHDPSWGPQQDEDAYFAHFQVSNQYIDPTQTSQPGASTTPTVTPPADGQVTPTATPDDNQMTPTATPPDNNQMTPTATPSTGHTVQVTTAGYAYPDNNSGGQSLTGTAAIAYPKNAGYPTLHDQASEGTGTYDDPITFAAYTPLTTGAQAIFPPGTKIYVPYLHKYFILEDSCDDCGGNQGNATYTLHLWLGPSSLSGADSAQSIEACRTRIAQATTTILLNPDSTYPVEQTPLYQNGVCSAKTFAS